MMGGSVPDSGIPAIVKLDCVVTVVDALRLVDEFAGGEKLIGDVDEEDIENLLIQQIEFCSTIIINKVDEVSAEDLAKVRAVVKALQPKAKIIETNYANVDIKDVLSTGQFDFDKTFASAGWVTEFEKDVREEHEHHCHKHDGEHHCHKHEEDHHCCHEHEEDHHCCHEHDEEHHGHHHCHHHHGEGEAEEYGIGSFVYYRRRPFDMAKLRTWLNNSFPENVIRCKGIIWIDCDNDMSFVLEQAGKQIQMSENGRWFASAPKKQLEKFVKDDPSIMDNWDEKVGDRMIKLVFIGRELDKVAISSELDTLLKEI